MTKNKIPLNNNEELVKSFIENSKKSKCSLEKKSFFSKYLLTDSKIEQNANIFIKQIDDVLGRFDNEEFAKKRMGKKFLDDNLHYFLNYAEFLKLDNIHKEGVLLDLVNFASKIMCVKPPKVMVYSDDNSEVVSYAENSNKIRINFAQILDLPNKCKIPAHIAGLYLFVSIFHEVTHISQYANSKIFYKDKEKCLDTKLNELQIFSDLINMFNIISLKKDKNNAYLESIQNSDNKLKSLLTDDYYYLGRYIFDPIEIGALKSQIMSLNLLLKYTNADKEQIMLALLDNIQNAIVNRFNIKNWTKTFNFSNNYIAKRFEKDFIDTPSGEELINYYKALNIKKIQSRFLNEYNFLKNLGISLNKELTNEIMNDIDEKNQHIFNNYSLYAINNSAFLSFAIKSKSINCVKNYNEYLDFFVRLNNNHDLKCIKKDLDNSN